VLYGLQRLPVVILTGAIIMTRGPSSEGPAAKSKRILALAILFNVLTCLPLTTWAFLFDLAGVNSCLLTVGSLVDVVYFCYALSLVLFFVFARLEYLRNMEECIWSHVSQIQV
jgi:hypothetical protein